MRRKTVTQTGIFLTASYLVVFTFNLLYALIFPEKYFCPDTITDLVKLSFCILLSLSTLFMGLKYSIVTQVVLVAVTGFFVIFASQNLLAVHGEVLVILALLLAKAYGLPAKRIKVTFVAMLLFCISIRLFTGIVQRHDLEVPEFVTYMIIVGIINIFFFIILLSVEQKIHYEAAHICSMWQKEQVYNDIGKNVFSSFVHDYNVSDIITAVELTKNYVQDGNLQEAEHMLDVLKDMSTEDHQRLNSVRERVVLSNETGPVTVDAARFIEGVLDKQNNSRGISEVKFVNTIHHQAFISIIRIDFLGIIENILKNSFEATKAENRKITVTLSVKKKSLNIIIGNNGVKIPWALGDGRVPLTEFRPGRTTKKRGTGWGVYTVIRRIQQNRGKLSIYSDDYQTLFSISFPLVSP